MVSVQLMNQVPRRNNACDDASEFLQQEKMAVNEKRCKEMLECKRQIDIWTAKLEVLKADHTVELTLARLRLDATKFWNSLSPEDKTEKRFILAAMESETLPLELENFQGSNLPPNIRADRDILLARVAVATPLSR